MPSGKVFVETTSSAHPLSSANAKMFEFLNRAHINFLLILGTMKNQTTGTRTLHIIASAGRSHIQAR
jgi:hypothetical protein